MVWAIHTIFHCHLGRKNSIPSCFLALTIYEHMSWQPKSLIQGFFIFLHFTCVHVNHKSDANYDNAEWMPQILLPWGTYCEAHLCDGNAQIWPCILHFCFHYKRNFEIDFDAMICYSGAHESISRSFSFFKVMI